jgi:hypothetical protein
MVYSDSGHPAGRRRGGGCRRRTSDDLRRHHVEGPTRAHRARPRRTRVQARRRHQPARSSPYAYAVLVVLPFYPVLEGFCCPVAVTARSLRTHARKSSPSTPRRRPDHPAVHRHDVGIGASGGRQPSIRANVSLLTGTSFRPDHDESRGRPLQRPRHARLRPDHANSAPSIGLRRPSATDGRPDPPEEYSHDPHDRCSAPR